MIVFLTIQIFSRNCEFISHDSDLTRNREFISLNSDFISRNHKFIARNSDCITHDCEFISHNSEFITCNCEFISHNSEKEVRIARNLFLIWLNKKSTFFNFFIYFYSVAETGFHSFILSGKNRKTLLYLICIMPENKLHFVIFYIAQIQYMHFKVKDWFTWRLLAGGLGFCALWRRAGVFVVLSDLHIRIYSHSQPAVGWKPENAYRIGA